MLPPSVVSSWSTPHRQHDLRRRAHHRLDDVISRHIPQANASLKGGQWLKNKYTGIEVRNKTIGIIGLGNIGSAVARRAQGMEMKVIAFDPFCFRRTRQAADGHNGIAGRIIQDSDFITIHTPLNAATKSIITEKEIALMKPSVRIINCARGGLIDEELLAKAITEKKIAGAAIDVFTKEPITESPLFKLDNVVVTPHLGASTAEAQVYRGQRCRGADRRCTERTTGPLCRQYPVRPPLKPSRFCHPT